ncbi:hypothetical protein L1887_51344 [Cichorium endivia]|nr:hypothetical protein L1887_51344 [Cichorium endivia]
MLSPCGAQKKERNDCPPIKVEKEAAAAIVFHSSPTSPRERQKRKKKKRKKEKGGPSGEFRGPHRNSRWKTAPKLLTFPKTRTSQPSQKKKAKFSILAGLFSHDRLSALHISIATEPLKSESRTNLDRIDPGLAAASLAASPPLSFFTRGVRGAGYGRIDTISGLRARAAGPSRASQTVLNTSSSDSDSDADSGDEVRSRSAVVTKKKRTNHNPLVQSTGAVRKQPRPDTAPDSEDDIYPASSASPASTAATSLQKIRDDATRHSNWDLDSSTPADAGSRPAMQMASTGVRRGSPRRPSALRAVPRQAACSMRQPKVLERMNKARAAKQQMKTAGNSSM